MDSKEYVIIANGEPPSKFILKNFLHGNQIIICCDGAIGMLDKLRIIPDYIIGDLDSADPSLLDKYRMKSEIIKINRQSDTDLEKALRFAKKEKAAGVTIFSASGKRFDHTIANTGQLLKYSSCFDIKMITNESVVVPLSGIHNFRSFRGEVVSLYGFDSQTRFTTRNLKYALRSATLPFGEKESTSNVSEKEYFGITVEFGKGILIRDVKSYLQAAALL